MNAYVYPRPHEKVISGAVAFGMHLLFIALLVFGVNWKKNVEPQANVVDLWKDLPSQSQSQPRIEPPPAPPAPVEPPKVAPAPPLPKIVPKPEVAKPDIAMKEKLEKEKADKEKAQKERRVLDDQKKEAKKREDEKQKQAREAVDAERRAKEQEDVQHKLAEQAAAARTAQVKKYQDAIRDKIRPFIVVPANMQGNPEAEFDVIQLPGGGVMSAKLKRSSGNAAYDTAVERAILKAQPLPPPSDPAIFTRELNLRFRPQE